VFAATGSPGWYMTMDYTVEIQGVAPVSDIVIQDGNCTLTNDFGYLDKDTPYISVLGSGQTATIYSVITSASGTSNGITKFSWGTLVLAGTNTYQGPTTIEGGTLQLGAPQVLPRTSTLVLAAGDTRTTGYTYGYAGTAPTFATGGYSQTLGPLLLTGPYTSLIHTLDFGSGASALAFADSHLQNWNGIPLTIVNYIPGVASLRFGTNSAGLTSAQLGLIQFDLIDAQNGNVILPAKIDSHGFVTPGPPNLSIVQSGTNSVKVTWGAINGSHYNVQFKTNLNDAFWMTNSILDVTGTNNAASFTDTIGTNKHRIYRILARPVENGT
jgi:autotransporter-associated beta strand protein